MKRVHLGPGMSARGSLAHACRVHRLAGKALGVDDDLDIGPLADDAIRTAWWTPLRDMYLNGLSTGAAGLDEQWRAIEPEIEAAEEVTIWTSDSARDQMYLRAAAAKLGRFSGRISLVHVPTLRGMVGVHLFKPSQLASLAAHSVVLKDETRDELAKDYCERLWGTDGVRYQTDDGLELRGYSAFDQQLLDACSAEFVNPTKAVGLAGACIDSRNWVGDMFLRWRLRHLVEAGLVRATGTRWFVDNSDVRVAR